MATWEDGPEYAPALRPDHFAGPDRAVPLSAVPPAEPSSPPAPYERPAFDKPAVAVVPLEALVPPLEDSRDPSVPFEVVSATVTEASSAWSAAHWNPPSESPVVTGPPPAAVSALPAFPATSAPAQLPAPYPGVLPAPPAPQPAPFPAPGTTSWFQPAPPRIASPPATARTGPGAIAQTLTVGVIIALVVGGIVWPLAPISFGVAFALASRVRVGRPPVVGAFTAGLSVLVVVGVVGALLSADVLLFFSEWWELVARWAQVLCWMVLVISWIAVWRALRTAPPVTGPPPTVWG